MTRQIYRTCLTALCLAALLAAMLLLAPRGLADGGAKDEIKIEGGAVTLVSARLAGEKVSSLKVSFTVPEGTVFTFAPAFGETWLTYASVRDGVMTLYVAGTTPLMAEGQTELVLGTVTNADQVRPVENSLGYVYGTRVVDQVLEVAAEPLTLREQLEALVQLTEEMYPEEDERPDVLKAALENAQAVLAQLAAGEEVTEEKLTATFQELKAALVGAESGAGSTSDARDALAALVERINEEYKDTLSGYYSEESWRPFNDALESAQALLEDANATDEALREATVKLEEAELALETQGQADLKAAIQAAKDKLNDGNEYAEASKAELEKAIVAAEALLAGGTATEDELKAAAADLMNKTENLPPQETADPRPTTPVVIPEETENPGTTDPTTAPTATAPATAEPTAEPTAAAPTATAAATKNPDSAPDTGDDTNLAAWAAVLCLGILGLAVVSLRRRAER